MRIRVRVGYQLRSQEPPSRRITSRIADTTASLQAHSRGQRRTPFGIQQALSIGDCFGDLHRFASRLLAKLFEKTFVLEGEQAHVWTYRSVLRTVAQAPSVNIGETRLLVSDPVVVDRSLNED